MLRSKRKEAVEKDRLKVRLLSRGKMLQIWNQDWYKYSLDVLNIAQVSIRYSFANDNVFSSEYFQKDCNSTTISGILH